MKIRPSTSRNTFQEVGNALGRGVVHTEGRVEGILPEIFVDRIVAFVDFGIPLKETRSAE
jgi:hypothetical protein